MSDWVKHTLSQRRVYESSEVNKGPLEVGKSKLDGATVYAIGTTKDDYPRFVDHENRTRAMMEISWIDAKSQDDEARWEHWHHELWGDKKYFAFGQGKEEILEQA